MIFKKNIIGLDATCRSEDYGSAPGLRQALQVESMFIEHKSMFAIDRGFMPNPMNRRI